MIVNTLLVMLSVNHAKVVPTSITRLNRVLMMLVQQISDLFDLVKTLFSL